MRPIVLDFDGSVGTLPAERRLALGDRQEHVRFACTLGTLRALESRISRELSHDTGPVFLGSGDFHHVSLALIRRLRTEARFDVVVLDNHPDNMRFFCGVHCGSWVRRVTRLPFVRHVHVLGITSGDVAGAHAWQNYLLPLWRRKLTYWCIGVDTRWAAHLRLGDAVQGFATPAAMIERFADRQRAERAGVYVSIDKDVLAAGVVRTNWDQGVMTEADLRGALDALRGRVIGSDVTGEVSLYAFASVAKRAVCALDHQPRIEPSQLHAFQAQQHALNLRLVECLGGLYVP